MIFLEELSYDSARLAAIIAAISTLSLLIFTFRGNGFCVIIKAVSIGIVGALPWASFLSLNELQLIFPGLKSKGQLLAFVLIFLVLLYELRVISIAILAGRSQRPEVGLISSREGEKGIRKILKFASSWERRFWLYALMTEVPSQDSFDGIFHFGTGKQNGNASAWLGWAIVNLVPTPIFHVLFHQKSPVAASLTTFACLMGSLWLWAEYRAATIRPISIDDQFFYLRYGLSTDRRIDRDSILEVKSKSYQDMDRGLTRYAGCGSPNVVVTLNSGEEIAIGVDSPGLLIEKLRPQESVVNKI
ncbi:MAG: hypothetical protein ABW154_08200 [Dyella sp.]